MFSKACPVFNHRRRENYVAGRFPGVVLNLPHHRQVRIYARLGVELGCTMLAAWVGKAAYETTAVYAAQQAILKTAHQALQGRDHGSWP
ncbi:hypothetical protein ETW24_19205 [Leisingera sp. NJS204]|nr:hypothetical protein ETW24_19205 [Leisingera sp. NJS204]